MDYRQYVLLNSDKRNPFSTDINYNSYNISIKSVIEDF